MATVFISYSHSDENMRKELGKHLSVLRRQGVISIWHDRLIGPGEEIHGQINNQLNSADIILLLVSVDFLDSDYCYDIEMKRALELHDENIARVIPVILRPCEWQGAPFGSLNAVPADGTPISEHKTLDHGFREVAQAVRQVAESLGGATPSAKPTLRMSTATMHPPTKAFPQSSDLRIKRAFTDVDKHGFMTDALKYIAGYFENSLNELQSQNADVKTYFRQVDTSFEAIAFVNGYEKSRCGIRLSRRDDMLGSHKILFSYDGFDSGFIAKDIMLLNNDGFTLYLELMGRHYSGSENKSMLTQEDAAEHYWSLFMQKLR